MEEGRVIALNRLNIAFLTPHHQTECPIQRQRFRPNAPRLSP